MIAKVKALLLVGSVAVLVVAVGGYVAARHLLRPYDVPEFAEIDTSESAFLIPLDGDTTSQAAFPSADLLDQRKVAVKRVQLPHRWQELGRLPGQGQWVPTVRLVKVDRRPVTRLWTKSPSSGTTAKDEAVAAETKESVNFSMGITCTAHIPEEQAATFLYSYPSKSLADMLDVEVRGRIQQVLAEEAAKYTLEQLPGKKTDMLQAVRADVVPFFGKRGILVSSVGMYGGIQYDNPEIQKVIDDGAKAAQLKVVAEAKREAAVVDAQRLKQEAEARAEAAKLEAKGKAEAEAFAAESQAKVKLAAAKAEAEAKQAATTAEAAGLRALAEARVFEAKEAAAGSGGDVYVRLRHLEAEAARWKGWDGKFPTTWMPVGEKATPFTALFPPLPGLTGPLPVSTAGK